MTTTFSPGRIRLEANGAQLKASRNAFRSIVLNILLAILAVPGLAAQGQPRSVPNRLPVTIVLTEDLDVADGAAVILRRKYSEPKDIILLDSRKIQAHTLEQAVITLMAARALSGDTASMDVKLRTAARRSIPPSHWSEREQLRAAAIVSRLRMKSPTEIFGVGRVPAVTIYLPVEGLKGKLRAK